MGNVAGPYSRTYGMDMRRYGALLGMSIWLAVGREHAPFPQESGMFEHGHDFCFGPAMAMVGTVVPDDVLPHLLAFQGEREVEQRLPTNHDRVATAWLGEKVMIGAESLRLTGELPGIVPNLDSDQYHAVTIHWQTPDGDVGWIRLRHRGPVEARAEQGRLTIMGPLLGAGLERYGEEHRRYSFEIFSHLRIAADLDANQWDLPGLLLQVESNLKDRHMEVQNGGVLATYMLPASEPEARFEFSVVDPR
jgi:hypothetical protein